MRGILGRVRILLFMGLCLALIGAAPARANHVQCGDTLVADTTLDTDLNCPENGVFIGAPGVTLDLHGHVIQGADERETGGVVALGSAFQGLEVRNGAIHGFPIGVYVDGPADVQVHGMLLSENALAVACLNAPRCAVRHNVIRHNGGGIRMAAAGEDPANVSLIAGNTICLNDIGLRLTGTPVTVTRNSIVQTTTDGIVVDNNGPVDIRGNVIARNGGDGIRTFFLAVVSVRNNFIVRNGANGVYIFGGFEFVTQADVRYNHVSRNAGDGVLVSEQGVTATVKGNRTDRNGDDGIGIEWSTAPACCFDVTVSANQAYANTDLGIEAVPETVDGGANRARRNGNPAQCVGVRCR
jgi:hypothetical protein